MSKTIAQIQEKLDSGEAIVLTADEVKTKLRDGEDITIDDVDVVTCGTSGVMSGTTALFHIPVSEPGLFNKAKEVYINGIPAYPGPCPNELLGSIDVFLYGTNHSNTIKDYGGGLLLKDLLEGKEVDVKVIDNENQQFNTKVTLDDFQTARLIGTRMAFKNYNSFTNPKNDAPKSIFNVTPMTGAYDSYSFSGCGEVNPLANDPTQEVIKENTKILLNGAQGTIISNGTRSNSQKPNLLLTADIKEMNPYYLGGFKTGLGPEIFDTVAIPIPVLNDNILENLKIMDKDIPLPICDIHGRHLPLGETDYTVWEDVDYRPNIDLSSCLNCEKCLIESNCPTYAFTKNEGIDDLLCYGCGVCTLYCPGQVSKMKLGSIKLESSDGQKSIPVTCRQSDKKRGLEIAEELKKSLLDGTFKL